MYNNNQKNCLIIIVVQLHMILETVLAGRGDPCVTPNKENATCKSIQDCNVIFDAIITQNDTALTFAQESQCGYDSSPLFCCGTTAYPMPSTTMPNFDWLFTTAPATSEPVQEKLDKNVMPNFAWLFTPEPETSEPVPEKLDQNVILGDFKTTALPDRTVCGYERGSIKVIGGSVTDIDEFPWMAALESRSKHTRTNPAIRCGGSLINNRYVLTAAHCILHFEFELISAWLGEWVISTDPDCLDDDASDCSTVLKLKLKEQIPHPYYSPKSKSNDIGILRLERDIKFTDYIRPICLPPPNLPNPPLNTLLTVSGWGATENGTFSDVKLKVEVPILANSICNEKLSGFKPINSDQLCAGGEPGKDSCEGDSGGPLMRTYQDTTTLELQWYQEGVVSWGVGCARPGNPAIYTRVSRYINWIINNISEEE